jgi:hypothetical protein
MGTNRNIDDRWVVAVNLVIIIQSGTSPREMPVYLFAPRDSPDAEEKPHGGSGIQVGAHRRMRTDGSES